MSLNVSMWSKVAIAVQSALATALTITGITKANPAVVTYTGTDPSNGDFVLATVQGMFQLDGRVFRVANVNAGANTLELEGENSTLYDTFTSGTLEVITFGTTLAATLGLSGSGGDAKFEDVTTIHDDREIQVPGNFSAINYALDNIWDVADAGLIALKYASDNKLRRAIKITFSNGQKVVFTGYISCAMIPLGTAPSKVTTPASITMFGRPTTYSS
jgi:hypothetical protein